MKIPFLPKTSTSTSTSTLRSISSNPPPSPPSPPTPPPPPPPPLFPNALLQSSSSTVKLFLTGATVGPIVDSLHNQCLLVYDRAPITIPMPAQLQLQLQLPFSTMDSSAMESIATTTTTTTTTTTITEVPSYLFCSSWYIPLLLGIAYVVLGDILPKIINAILVSPLTTSFSFLFENGIEKEMENEIENEKENEKLQVQEVQVREKRYQQDELSTLTSISTTNIKMLRKRALLAVSSTALIIKLSDYLQTHSSSSSLLLLLSSFIKDIITKTSISDIDIDIDTNIDTNRINLSIMITAALLQWAVLDGTLLSLITASIVSIGGPLSELPFVANGFWHYIPSAADYVPLADVIKLDNTLVDVDVDVDVNLEFLREYKDLALSSITGPCYFAVTMDAIALGRWFNSSNGGSNTNVEK